MTSSNTISHVTKNVHEKQTDEVWLQRILIVEDETKLLDHLTRTVNEDGFSTFKCTSFNDLENLFKIPGPRFDAVILDRLLHGKDSAELISQMKDILPNVKILILSAINTPSEKATLLDLGADDYLAKPFYTEELVARIRALLRRNRSELQLGNVLLDSDKRTVKVNNQEVSIQNKEFVLLRALIRTPGKVFNKIDLYENVWEMSTEVESNVVETTINKIRRRLEEAGANIAIKSMRNKGYWIEE